MTPAEAADATARPRVEGDREQRDPRRRPRGARRGRLRPAHHGRRRPAREGLQGDALPALELQGEARRRALATEKTTPRRCPTPATCAPTC